MSQQVTISEVRQKFRDFYESKRHVWIPSASLIPENDPTTLFTGSGMQPLLPYLLGQQHPQGRRLADSQKSFRAEDIDQVGDNRHTTFFEMLGNWSLGDYFKDEQLTFIFDFLTKEVGLDPARLYVTVFAGDGGAGVPQDTESATIWQEVFSRAGIDTAVVEIGSEEIGYQQGMQGGRIFYYDANKNWWSRSGPPERMPVGEPGGPDSEIFYDFGTEHDSSYGEHCHPNCDCGRFVEIGNSVFMEYQKQGDGSFMPLPQRNVDFGGGLERIVAAANHNPDVFSIDVFASVMDQLKKHYDWEYTAPDTDQATMRKVADHMRSAVFLISDGVYPSNSEQGYVLRRLLRVAIRYASKFAPGFSNTKPIVDSIITSYTDVYPALEEKHKYIMQTVEAEEQKFLATLMQGEKRYQELAGKTISGESVFDLYTTYGFPLELTEELAAKDGYRVDVVDFTRRMNEHRQKSRAGATQKFAGGLADHSAMSVKYHTATHLLHQALRDVLGVHVFQKGSNITAKRLRFDFSHPEKMTAEERDQVEAEVNNVIRQDLVVTREEMSVPEAKEKGALGLFEDKYQDTVNVYSIGDYSCEICGGPHVAHTGVLGTFKITKEESAGAGIRRLKAILES
jgi:alanyl-tRNA synthetase